MNGVTWRHRRPAAPLTTLAVSSAVLVATLAADWPQWRGPTRDGVTPERSNWPEGWPPRRLWTANVGRGCTSPILVAGRVYVMGWQGKGRGNSVGTDTVHCLDALTGKTLWRQTYPCRYQGRVRAGDLGQYGGPSATPALDRDTGYLYTLSIDGDLRCWDTNRDGQPVWGRNLYDTYRVPRRPNVGGGQRDFGFTTSPLIEGASVIVEVGDRAGTLMALDKRSGRRQWASRCTDPAGHTSGPVAMTVQGKRCLATLTLRRLVIVRADKGHEGETLAAYPWTTDYGCNIPTPAVRGNGIVLTSAYNRRRTALLELRPTGVTEKWSSRSHAMASSPVVHKGRVYLVNGSLKCLDLGTGALVWKGGQYGHGSCLVTAGDDTVLAFGRGSLALLEAAPATHRYRELARVDRVVRGTCYPHVALSDGIICCKDMLGATVCFSVRSRARKTAPGKRGT